LPFSTSLRRRAWCCSNIVLSSFIVCVSLVGLRRRDLFRHCVGCGSGMNIWYRLSSCCGISSCALRRAGKGASLNLYNLGRNNNAPASAASSGAAAYFAWVLDMVLILVYAGPLSVCRNIFYINRLNSLLWLLFLWKMRLGRYMVSFWHLLLSHCGVVSLSALCPPGPSSSAGPGWNNLCIGEWFMVERDLPPRVTP